ncbi:MAG: prepilin-type N-terminal cleavage/methylation domain-containing protein [Planctomycetales bacterium]|nr:prepilin-type N-terminal cleavage/methylation domain-containing protein [Planctomycetales bacterium]
MTPNCNRHRSGMSLVETLVVMTLGTVVMSGLVVGMTALLRVDARLAKTPHEQRLTRFTESMRADLHAAQRAEWDSDDGVLTLTSGKAGEVVYRFTGDRATRTAGDASQAFRLPPDARVACEPPDAQSPALVELSIADASSPVPVVIVAGLGRDARLYESRGGEG